MTASAAILVSPAPAGAASAPDLGRPFEPTPISQPIYAVKAPSEDPARQRTRLEASDGVDLFLETWLPKEKDGQVPPGRIPTVLVISPYVRQGDLESTITMNALVPRGYAYSQLNVRGTGESGGCIEDHTMRETDDGARAVEYLGTSAPWSNGVVGGFGYSYPGGSIFSVAASGDRDKVRYLKAIISAGPVASRYDTKFLDGVPQIIEGPASFPVFLSLARPGETTTPVQLAERPGCAYEQVRQSHVDDPSGDFTPYYQAREHRQNSPKVEAATLMLHGLQDLDVQGTMQAGMFERIQAPKHGYFGVFGHELPSNHSLTGLQRDWERPDWPDTLAAWFDYYLKGLPSGADTWPTVEVQGTDGQWRAEPDWPTTGGPPAQLGFAPGGRLDNGNPVGATRYVELEPESAVGRSDVSAATFETGPLPERLEITGQPVLDLWVTLDRPDAHLAAAFEARDAQGETIEASRVYGARSARHLDPLVNNRFAQAEGRDAPVGRPVRVPLRLQPADVVVPKGGRLRVVVAGSVKTGVGLNELAKYFGIPGLDLDPGGIAQPTQPSGGATSVTLHHDCAHPSALRFLMPRAQPDLLNVREKDEPAGTPLADNRPYEPPVSDAGGLATAPLCGRRPVDPQTVTGRRCLSHRSPIGPRNIGRVRLGFSRRRLLRLPVKPSRRTRRSHRYCVKRSRGRVSAVFSRRGRVVLVATTARLHGNRGVRPGVSVRALRRAYSRRRLLGRGLYRANRSSPRVIGTRKRRVRFVAVANRRLLRSQRALRRHLRLAGL